MIHLITDSRCTEYHRSGHPERPQRIQGTVELLRRQTELPLQWESPVAVSEEQLRRAHQPAMIDWVRTAKEDFDGDTPLYPGIDQHALRSVGAALQTFERARRGDWAFSLIRPPGHHATREQPMGFCYFNSIAIAALQARAEGFKRVAVFDFDVHHGNGTEDILLGQHGTAFYSIHQFPCYPGTGESDLGDNCFNFPFRPSIPRREYRELLQQAFQALQKFKPDCVAVSAGFDGYARDPLAQGTLEAEDYQWLGKQFRGLGVPVVSILEGGYSSDLPELVFAYLHGLSSR